MKDARSVRAVVFNKHGVGQLVRVEHFPVAGETIRALEWSYGEDAGKGTNVAIALSLLGVRSALVCKVGDDVNGRLGEKWLREAGADCSHYIMSPAIKTDVGLVITQSNGENLIIGSPAHECYSTKMELLSAIDEYRDARYFVTGFEIDTELPLIGCKYAKEHGKITILNPSPISGKIKGSLDYVDYLFVNEVESMQMVGIHQGECDWGDIARRICEVYSPGVLVITLGSEGCLLCNDGKITYFEPYEVECVDSAGAGDGFMSAFIAGIDSGMTNAEAVDWANKYSAICVSRRGVILAYPSLQEAKEIGVHLQRRRKDGGT